MLQSTYNTLFTIQNKQKLLYALDYFQNVQYTICDNKIICALVTLPDVRLY